MLAPKNIYKKVLIVAATILFTSSVFAKESVFCRGFYGSRFYDLKNDLGNPFFSSMLNIRNTMDVAAMQLFKIASWDVISKKTSEFHPDAYGKILRYFISGADVTILHRDSKFETSEGQAVKLKAEEQFKVLIDALNGAEVSAIDYAEIGSDSKVPQIVTVLKKELLRLKMAEPKNATLMAMNLATFLSIVSGAGSKVVINDQNFFVNVGYELDEQDRAEKSGRSSSSSPFSGFNDASDTFLLTSLHKMVSYNTRATNYFYEAMFDLLLKSDSSTYAKLTAEEQGNLTDFIAVYSAEFRRSWMSKLKAHRWMDDLAEVYIVSAFGSHAGMVMGEQGWAKGEAKTFFAVGSDGSGIGVMREYRRYEQHLVTEAVRQAKPELIETLEKLTGLRKPMSDVIYQFQLYINDPANQAEVKANSSQLAQAMTELTQFFASNFESISSYVGANTDMKVIAKFNVKLQAKRDAKKRKDAAARK